MTEKRARATVTADSVASFSAMADGEDCDFFAVVLIECNVGGLAELNDQFPSIWHCIVDGAAYGWMTDEELKTLIDCLDGPRG